MPVCDMSPHPSCTLTLAQDGETPLHFAAMDGFIDVAKLLLDSKAAISVVDKVSAVGGGRALAAPVFPLRISSHARRRTHLSAPPTDSWQDAPWLRRACQQGRDGHLPQVEGRQQLTRPWNVTHKHGIRVPLNVDGRQAAVQVQ